MIELTPEFVEATLTEIVDEYGYSYVYVPQSGPGGDCSYVHGDDSYEEFVPGCLVGHFFHRIGVMDLDDMGNSTRNASADAKELTNYFQKKNLVSVSDDRVPDMLYAAQYRQDLGHAWGEALGAAVNVKNEER